LFPLLRDGVLAVIGLVWALSMVIFLAFPLYERRLRTEGKNAGLIFFDIGQRGIPLIFWGIFLTVLFGYALLVGGLSWALLLRWSAISLVVVLLLSIDLMGSTPAYKSGLHEDRLLRITLDPKVCKGAGFCEQVCPVEVFQVDHILHMARLPGAHQCVQCGACIVQCPFDALYFQSPSGDVVPPQTIRSFKLNLLGSRLVKSGGPP